MVKMVVSNVHGFIISEVCQTVTNEHRAKGGHELHRTMVRNEETKKKGKDWRRRQVAGIPKLDITALEHGGL